MMGFLLASLALADATAVKASLVLKVGQPEAAEDALVAAAEALGGWFQARTLRSVSLRVPGARVEELLLQAGELGVVADRKFSTSDLTIEIEDQRSRLRSREGSLAQYYALLRTASPKSVVAIERKLTSLVEEIESLRGRIRFLEHQGTWGQVTIDLAFRDRRPPTRDGDSSFPWLNTVNLEDLVVDLGQAEGWGRTAPAHPAVPDGFSVFRDQRQFRAVAADGVLYRVRATEEKPTAELLFWKNALRDRMQAAGYQVVAESDLRSGAVDGALLELRAALGGRDWTYLVAVFPVDGDLVIVEAAGEVVFLEARKDAIGDAMRDLGL